MLAAGAGLVVLALACVCTALVARNRILETRLVPRIGPLLGGTFTVESARLALHPPVVTATGIRLVIPQIRGTITARTLRIAPLAGDVSLGGLVVQRDEPTEKLPILTVDQITAHADRRQLRTAPFVVDDVRIDQPTLRLRFVGTNQTNLQALFATSARAAPPPARLPATSVLAPDTASGAKRATVFELPPPLFLLRSGQIRGGTIVYDDPLSDAVRPVHLELRGLDADVHDFQVRGAPLAGALADLRLDARVDQLVAPARIHARAWIEPWRERPTLTLLAAITGFDVRTIQPYVPSAGRMALGGNWLHAALEIRARAARIQQGAVKVTVAESGDELVALLSGDLFHPTIDKNSALVSAFRLPLGQFLRFGDVSVSVAAELALAGLDSVLRIGQDTGDSGAAPASRAPASAPQPRNTGDEDFLAQVMRGMSAFGSGVANTAKGIFQRGQSGYESATAPARPMEDILAEFEPRHRQLTRAFLSERIHVARRVDPSRIAALEAELAAIPPGARPASVTTRGAELGTGKLAQ
ncbi:MAG: DUF748 domain-containing protein [bacterium]